ncbi:hypothetical protein ACFPM0_37380 [Pseudonocardia sulfidoxydans]|uniref:hypothetical protein n=1 Tax=Pseudonocardia sulfidoxydans TaxID=54011 RepID=UPI003614088F
MPTVRWAPPPLVTVTVACPVDVMWTSAACTRLRRWSSARARSSWRAAPGNTGVGSCSWSVSTKAFTPHTTPPTARAKPISVTMPLYVVLTAQEDLSSGTPHPPRV